MKRAVISALIVAASALASTQAFADCTPGFFANVLCETGVINQDTAQGIDQVHKGIGAPLNQIVPRFPGAGGGGGAPAPQFQPPIAQAGGPGFANGGGFNAYNPQQMGNMCVTPWGQVQQGPWNPVGAPCGIVTPYGQVIPGTVR
ncbi:hypothetical protein GR223_23440 [Rhizobium leguminosarum]|uniref:hypothetical protein n=1 Tax=Rhizobium ruizarguesonis TaxID=2081791 RepID=UPI0013DF49EF|nr:hypothetical protein [Rhizobium ruizarguesonis]NEJ88851.1 hypothetical protein [Rhizobium ruizarguesonis]